MRRNFKLQTDHPQNLGFYESVIETRFEHTIDGTSITIGKITYPMHVLRVLSAVVSFLGLVLLFMGIFSIMAGNLVIGIVSCVVAVLTMIYGWIYRVFVKKAYRMNGKRFL